MRLGCARLRPVECRLGVGRTFTAKKCQWRRGVKDSEGESGGSLAV